MHTIWATIGTKQSPVHSLADGTALSFGTLETPIPASLQKAQQEEGFEYFSVSLPMIAVKPSTASGEHCFGNATAVVSMLPQGKDQTAYANIVITFTLHGDAWNLLRNLMGQESESSPTARWWQRLTRRFRPAKNEK